jgi:hypothetical protein
MTRRAYVTLWARGVTYWTEFEQRAAQAKVLYESGLVTWDELMAERKETV